MHLARCRYEQIVGGGGGGAHFMIVSLTYFVTQCFVTLEMTAVIKIVKSGLTGGEGIEQTCEVSGEVQQC